MTRSGNRAAPEGGEPSGVRLPDLLTASRCVLGPLFAAVLPLSPAVALAVAVVAAATDFLDGRLARRWGGGSARGAVFDVVGDAVFVLFSLAALAHAGVVSSLLPAAAGISLAAFALTWRRRRPAENPRREGAHAPGTRRLPDRIGHAAGVLNYGAAVLGAGVVAFDVRISLIGASALVALINLLPLPLRWFSSR